MLTRILSFRRPPAGLRLGRLLSRNWGCTSLGAAAPTGYHRHRVVIFMSLCIIVLISSYHHIIYYLHVFVSSCLNVFMCSNLNLFLSLCPEQSPLTDIPDTRFISPQHGAARGVLTIWGRQVDFSPHGSVWWTSKRQIILLTFNKSYFTLIALQNFSIINFKQFDAQQDHQHFLINSLF